MVFKLNTTLVLGAGASCGYGFPTGHELIETLIHATSRPTNESQSNLNRKLSFFDPISIDSFLYHYKDDKELVDSAKEEIALAILRCCKSNKFQRMLKSDFVPGSHEPYHWYRYLWDAIVSGLTPNELCDPSKLKLNIITFNYDPSLEHYLYGCVTNSSFLTQDQQRSLLQTLSERIHHVYGELLPYKYGCPQEGLVSYNSCGDAPEQLLRSYGKNIRLIDERDQDEHYTVIRDILSKSEQVIFLGFGFDETNIGPKVLNLAATLNQYSTYRALRDNNPIIKFTNFNDQRIIADRMKAVYAKSIATRESMFKDSQGYNHTITKASKEYISSPKSVYRALSEDFTLT